MNATNFVRLKILHRVSAALVAVLLVATAAGAQSIPALLVLPEEVAAADPGLVRWRAELMTERDRLRAQSASHNARCRAVQDGTALEGECAASRSQFNAAVNQHIERSRIFNSRAEAPVRQVKFQKLLQSHKGDDHYVAIDAPLVNDPSNRNAYEYGRVLHQFDVGKSERYQRDLHTYCNIFVWDVTRAMKAEIPLMKANEIEGWLHSKGKDQGWRRIDPRGAQEMSDKGRPTIAVWKNLGFDKEGHPMHGHVSMIRPGSVGDPRGDAIAAAGASPVDASHMKKDFRRDDVQYWYHD